MNSQHWQCAPYAMRAPMAGEKTQKLRQEHSLCWRKPLYPLGQPRGVARARDLIATLPEGHKAAPPQIRCTNMLPNSSSRCATVNLRRCNPVLLERREPLCLWHGCLSSWLCTCPSGWAPGSRHDNRGRSQGWERASTVNPIPTHCSGNTKGSSKYLPVPLAGGTKQRGHPSPVGPRHGSSTLQQQLTHLQLSSPGSSGQG